MMPDVDPYSPLFTLRVPHINLKPTPLEELRDLAKNVAYYWAWTMVRMGLALSRRVEPCDVCPRCGPYPCIGHDGRCAECGAETYNTKDTGGFQA